MHRPGTLLFGSLFLLFFNILIFASLLYAQNLIPALKRDDFNQVHAWWEYHRDGIPKNDTTAIRNGGGFLAVQLSNPLRSKEFNAGISEFQNIYGKKYSYLSAEARIKLLSPLRLGSRGWGFWKSSKRKVHRSIAWFMQQKDAQNKRLSWSLVGTVDGKRRQVKPWQPDIDRWHVYRIERDLKTKTTRFWIDGKLYLNTNGLAPRERLSFHLWIDNQVYSKKDGIHRQQWSGSEAMVVDYVQIQTQRNLRKPEIPNTPRILFYRHFNRILWSSEESYSVGHYRFETPGDSVYLLLTARAEDLRPYDLADRLTVTIDKRNDPVLQVDGSLLKGKTRTVIKKLYLPHGAHQMHITAQATPLLYDVLILDATGAKIALNTQEQAKAASQTLWQANVSGSYLLYAAVSANEAPEFDQIKAHAALETHDDDLYLNLQNERSGTLQNWSFCGNQIFGDCRTRLAVGVLPAGKNKLTVRAEGKPQINRLFLIYW